MNFRDLANKRLKDEYLDLLEVIRRIEARPAPMTLSDPQGLATLWKRLDEKVAKLKQRRVALPGIGPLLKWQIRKMRLRPPSG